MSPETLRAVPLVAGGQWLVARNAFLFVPNDSSHRSPATSHITPYQASPFSFRICSAFVLSTLIVGKRDLLLHLFAVHNL